MLRGLQALPLFRYAMAVVARRGHPQAAARSIAVFASVHHADVVAHRVGEPYGTLVLALAITVIEVALIVSLMLAGGADKATLPRDTIYSAVMIICNGVVGICILVGGLHHREQSFRVEGMGPGLAALLAFGASGISSEAGYGGVGPNFLPWMVAGALALCGALLLWQALSTGFAIINDLSALLPGQRPARGATHARAGPAAQDHRHGAEDSGKLGGRASELRHLHLLGAGQCRCV